MSKDTTPVPASSLTRIERVSDRVELLRSDVQEIAEILEQYVNCPEVWGATIARLRAALVSEAAPPDALRTPRLAEIRALARDPNCQGPLTLLRCCEVNFGADVPTANWCNWCTVRYLLDALAETAPDQREKAVDYIWPQDALESAERDLADARQERDIWKEAAEKYAQRAAMEHGKSAAPLSKAAPTYTLREKPRCECMYDRTGQRVSTACPRHQHDLPTTLREASAYWEAKAEGAQRDLADARRERDEAHEANEILLDQKTAGLKRIKELETTLATRTQERDEARKARDAESKRVDIVIAEFDAPWPHSHTVGEVTSGSLAWKIHECRRDVEDARIAAEQRAEAAEATLARLREALQLDRPYPAADVLTQLADAADHLLRVHNCDAQGWEGVGIVCDEARRIAGALAGDPEGAYAPKPIMVDRDADLRREMRAYLDTLTITDDTIGDIRRSLFVPWDSLWNGWVRDETAARERKPAEGTVSPAPATEEEAAAERLRKWVGDVSTFIHGPVPEGRTPQDPLCRCPDGTCHLHPSLTTCGMRTRVAASPGAGPAPQDELRRMFAAGIKIARNYGDNAFHLHGDQLERQFQRALQSGWQGRR